LILTKSRQAVARWCTGSVPSVLKVDHTCLWQGHITELATMQVAPIVPAKRLASATCCSHCTLRWLQSMTLPGMVLGLSRSCQGPTKWPSGRMQAGTPGNKLLSSELTQKQIEASERQSARGLGSTSWLHLIRFDCAIVKMYLSCICDLPCAIFHHACHVEIGALYVSDESLLLTFSCLSTDLVVCLM